MQQGYRSLGSVGCAIAALLLLVVVGLMTGCEEISGDSRGDLPAVEGSFTLSPSSYRYSEESMHTVAFTVNGGKPPFRWSVSDEETGTISAPADEASPARSVNYRPTSADPGAVNVLRVQDSRGWSVTATISRRR